MSQPLPPEDQRHLEAAWDQLELGRYWEANQELEKVTAGNRVHPDFLDVRWEVYRQGRQWFACEDIARAIIQIDPRKLKPWIQLARSFHFRGSADEAFRVLLEVVYLFPKCSDLYYQLAIFACHLERIEQARSNLAMAIELAEDRDRVRMVALEDPELRRLWEPGDSKS